MKGVNASAQAMKLARYVKSLPLLLYSYIATEMLAPFFASFIILYCIFFLVRLIPLLDVVLDLRIGLADFVRMCSYIFPYMLVYVIPMASMTGMIIAFTRLTADREMLAFKASGVSLRQMLPPVILVALGISLLTAFFSVKLIPAGNVAMKHLFFQLAKEKIDKGLQEKAFTETLGDLVVYVDNIDENEQWKGVYVSDMRNRTQPIIIMAERGQLRADIENMLVTIVLGNGTIHSAEGTENQTVQFSRYQLNIPIPSPTRVHGEDVTMKDRSSMTQKELLAMAESVGKKTERGIVFLTEFHERLVLPVGCFILTILGLPLGMQSAPGRRGIGIPLGLGFFVFYYVLTTMGTILCEKLVIPVTLGMWLPCIILGSIAFLMIKRVDEEKPLVSAWLLNRFIDLFDYLFKPLIRFIRISWARLLHIGLGKEKDLTVYFPSDMQIHANATERVYHYPGCDFYNCKDCTIRFKSSEIAEEAGFKACDYCHPDLGEITE